MEEECLPSVLPTLQSPAPKTMFFLRAPLQYSVGFDVSPPEPPKHLAMASRFCHRFFSTPQQHPPHSPAPSIATPYHQLQAFPGQRGLTHFYVTHSTWHRPRPLRALKSKRLLARNCNSRPDSVSEKLLGFRGSCSSLI